MSVNTLKQDQQQDQRVEQNTEAADVLAEMECMLMDARVSTRTAKVYDQLSVQDAVAQGDVYLQLICDTDPLEIGGKEVSYTDHGTLFEDFYPDGDSASFASHVVRADPQVQRVSLLSTSLLLGPVFRVSEGGMLRMDHPEHADVILKTPGWYAMRYQRMSTDEAEHSILQRRLD